MKKKIWIGVGACILLGGGVWYLSSRSTTPVYETVSVVRGSVENVVSVTGHLEPVDRIVLSFPQGGLLQSVYVREGQVVSAGARIASLEQGELLSAVGEAQARVAREQAVLAELQAPLTSETRAVQEAAVREAQQAEKNADAQVRTTLMRTFSVVDDAVHEEADELFTGKTATTKKFGVRFTYGTTEYVVHGTSQEESMLTEKRRLVGSVLERLQERAQNTTRPVAELAEETESDLATVEDFLTALAGVVNAYIPDDVQAQTVYESYQSSVASARAAVSAIRTDLRAAQSSYEAAVAARVRVQEVYTETQAGATPAAKRVQEASLRVAEESVVRAREAAEGTSLYAPFPGTVANIVPRVGETVAAHSTIAELLTVGAYEVELFIPEADIARISIGNTAKVTFDALDRGQVFDAEVVRIALVETVREGVPTYKTRLALTTPPPAEVTLRPGMTADAEILTDVHEHVLTIPTRSVIIEDARSFVRVLNARGELEERDVVPGLRGSEGVMEIREGLTEGEQIVVFVQEE
jgi:RND family efflux transporter MFP subunit